MALVKADLKAELVTLFNTLKTYEDQSAAIDKLAGDMATAIDNFVKTGAVTVASGISLSTGGTTNATGTGTIA